MLKVAAECHLHGLVHRDMKPEVYLDLSLAPIERGPAPRAKMKWLMALLANSVLYDYSHVCIF